MPEPFDMSPELAGILNEIASDPRATLLRLPRPRELRRQMEPELLSPWRTGTTTAEQELLRVHRCELAFVLRQACASALYSDPQPVVILTRSVTTSEELEFPGAKLAIRNVRALAGAGNDERALDAERTLMRLKDNHVVAAQALATLLYAVEPNDKSACWLGLSMICAGKPQRGREVLERAVDIAGTPLLKSYIYENIGLARNLEGQDFMALAAYKASAICHPYRPSPLVSWLALAAVHGIPDEVSAAISQMRERIPDGHPWVRRHATAIAGLRRTGQWNYRPLKSAVLEALNNAGENGRRLGHVLK